LPIWQNSNFEATDYHCQFTLKMGGPFKKRELFFEDWFAHKGLQGETVYRQKMIHANQPQLQN